MIGIRERLLPRRRSAEPVAPEVTSPVETVTMTRKDYLRNLSVPGILEKRMQVLRDIDAKHQGSYPTILLHKIHNIEDAVTDAVRDNSLGDVDVRIGSTKIPLIAKIVEVLSLYPNQPTAESRTEKGDLHIFSASAIPGLYLDLSVGKPDGESEEEIHVFSLKGENHVPPEVKEELRA